MMRHQVFFDGRSAGTSRISGWERYARGLASLVIRSPDVAVYTSAMNSSVARLGSDLVLGQRSRRYMAAHFVSFPPLLPSRTTVTTLHDLTWWKYPETASRGGRLYYKQLAENSIGKAWLCTVSSAVALEIQEYFGERVGEVHVVNPLFRTTSVVEEHDQTESNSSRPYFVAVGTVEPRKNLTALASAFNLTKAKRDFDLVLVGRKGWGEIPSGVKFIDTPSDTQLDEILRNAHAVVIPSLYEGFGLPILEGHNLGKIILCSDLPVFREVSGGLASFFDPLDLESIAATIDASVNDHADVARARENVMRYSEPAILKQLSELYNRVGLKVSLSV